MEPAAKRRLSAREYLALERKADGRSEFLDGEMFAMAGGTRKHSLIAGNIIGELREAVRRKSCQVFTSDLRVKIQATGLYTYPDVTVACGHLQFEDASEDVLLHPKIIVEVLSDSTAAWDRGKKFWHYRHLDSLMEYVLVSPDGWLVEHFSRQPDDEWRLNTLDGAKSALDLRSIKARLPLTEVYRNTGLKPGVLPPDPQPQPTTKR